MKTTRFVLVLTLSLSILASAGCKQKTTPQAPNRTAPSSSSTPASPAPNDLSAAAKQLGQSASTAASAATAAAQKFTFDASKSLDTVKAEAAKMDVTQLRTIAQSLLASIKEKQAQIAKMSGSEGGSPLDNLGAAKQAGADLLKQAQDALAAMKAQFKVYYDALVAKGGDTSGLQMP